MANVDVKEVGDDDAQLNALERQMMHLDVDEKTSLSQAKRAVREQGSRVCLDCYAVFETPSALRRHMTKRGHFKRLQDLKEDRTEFAERVQGRGENQWTEAERATCANLKMRFANLLYFYKR